MTLAVLLASPIRIIAPRAVPLRSGFHALAAPEAEIDGPNGRTARGEVGDNTDHGRAGDRSGRSDCSAASAGKNRRRVRRPMPPHIGTNQAGTPPNGAAG